MSTVRIGTLGAARIALKVLVGRNEPGVRSMLRQLYDVLGRV